MANTSKKKILVIDDDAALRNWMHETLTGSGYDCHEAGDGGSGVALANLFLPDVVLCDIEMEKISGYDVFGELARNPKTALIPFIFVTGHDLRDEVRKGMNLGADDYLTKPMTTGELLDSVRARLGKKQFQARQTQTKIQRARDAIVREHSHDRLTHLPNRQLLLKKFREINQNEASEDSLTVLSVGVDNLDRIAEGFGDRCEEAVLCGMARRLNRILSAGATLFQGKHDSFDILIREDQDKGHLESVMKEIVHGLSESFAWQKQVLRTKISVGCAFSKSQALDSEETETILNRAETARYVARKEAEKGYQFYVPKMQKSVVDLFTLENQLYKALKNDEFSLFYQPQVDIGTYQIKAVEALIRWKSRKLGMISPLQFLPLAEENGLIVSIGKWVLEESCRQLKKWHSESLRVRVAVNVSGRQLEAGDLVNHVEDALNQAEVPPDSLELEITESLLMKDLDGILEQMKAFKQRGVRMAIDDFGTGYSSLNCLKKLPFDTLKIDRSFINDIETHAANTEIVATIIKMAKTLKLKSVAEGVETREQLKCLKGLHCDEFQGFLYSRPVPASEILPLIERGAVDSAESLTPQNH